MTQLTPPTWSRVKAILADALDVPPAEREAFLNRACAGQPALRRRLDNLVRAYSTSPALDDADSPARAIAAPFEPQPGSRLGHYRIVRLIGRGGMGAVYEAFDDHLARPVAVKLMQAGIASRSMLRRFDLESRLLARLRHPGIAQIFEAGTVPIPGMQEQAPFFAMELISGATPITTFAQAQRLSTEDRLRLFIKVCEAVTHGHQRSVIHRDLKPANILVDASGQPKIIDFGVARATDPGAAATTLAGELLGTLRYMSPEQVSGGSGDPEDLDVRTDVYSLGVVLYELLAGQAPHRDPTGGVLASIREAQNRTPVPLSRIAPQLSADIQTVALKAVQPDREARYPSVGELAADVDRILRHEPISARPLSAMYQIRMFTRRHRALVAGFIAVVAALMLGVVGTSIGFFRARHAERAAVAQTRRAERIAAFFENTVRSADPQLPPVRVRAALRPETNPWESWIYPVGGWGSAGPAEVGVAGVLRHAAGHLQAEFGDDPALLAEVSILLAQTLAGLEDPGSAEKLLASAVATQSRILSADDPVLLRTRAVHAVTIASIGQFTQADAELQEVIAAARSRFGEFDPRTLALGDALIRNRIVMPGCAAESVAMARAAIDRVAAACGPDSPAVWMRHLTLIDVLRIRSTPADHAELVSECRATLRGLEQMVGPDAVQISLVSWNLALELLANPSSLPEAEALERRALRIDEQFYGIDSNSAYDRRSDLIGILMRQRKLADAEELAREALASAVRMIGPRSSYTFKAQARLARVLTWRERNIQEAERLAAQAAESAAAAYGPNENYASYHQAIWAAAIRQLGHPEKAETMLRERLAARGNRPPQESSGWVEAYQFLQLALCLEDEHRGTEAAEAIRTARRWGEKLNEPTHPILLNILDVQPRIEKAGAPSGG